MSKIVDKGSTIISKTPSRALLIFIGNGLKIRSILLFSLIPYSSRVLSDYSI
jgi:hypothetical protein